MMTPIIRSDMRLYPGMPSGKIVVRKKKTSKTTGIDNSRRTQSLDVIYESKTKRQAAAAAAQQSTPLSASVNHLPTTEAGRRQARAQRPQTGPRKRSVTLQSHALNRIEELIEQTTSADTETDEVDLKGSLQLSPSSSQSSQSPPPTLAEQNRRRHNEIGGLRRWIRAFSLKAHRSKDGDGGKGKMTRSRADKTEK